MALKEAGCRVLALCPRRGHSLRKTKAVERVRHYNPFEPLQSIATAVRETKPDLIVPCDDQAVSHLHQLHGYAVESGDCPSLVRTIEESLGSPSSFPIALARNKLLNVAHEAGVRSPVSAAIRDRRDVEAWRARNSLPWVLKTDGSWGGHGVRVVRSEREAEDALASLARPLSAARALKRLIANRDPFWIKPWLQGIMPRISVQTYIRGYPANRGIFCWQGKVLAGISVDVIGALAVTGSAAVVRVVDNPQMTEAGERLAARLHWSGFYGLDFMIEESSRDAYLIEINPRCTPLCHLQLADGQNLVAALYCQLTGSQPRHTKPVTQNEVVAYFPQAWLWNPASEFLRDGYHDVPWEEPELVRDLCRLPWPDRSYFARISDRLRNHSFEARAARGCIFPAALGKGLREECWSVDDKRN